MALTQTVVDIPDLVVGSDVFEAYLSQYRWLRETYERLCDYLLATAPAAEGFPTSELLFRSDCGKRGSIRLCPSPTNTTLHSC